MKRVFVLIQLALFSLLSVSAHASDDAKLQPQQWQMIQEKVVPGDIPELQGLPVNPELPVSDHVVETLSQSTLDFLAPSDSLGYLVTASLFGMILLFVIFIAVNGTSKLSQGFSGKKVDRWSKADVSIHWLGAIACLFLIITGIILAAGRFILEPNMGEVRWLGVIQSAVALHDLMAFPFIIGALLMMVKWASKQLPESGDLAWFKACGGYLNFGRFKGKHPDAGFANAGEKLWFWTFTIFGLIIIGSGLIMMFPETLSVGKSTALMAIVLHIISAIIISAFTVVHIFMATIISEGGMECMVSGQCDENWAKQHHSLWYRDQQKAGKA